MLFSSNIFLFLFLPFFLLAYYIITFLFKKHTFVPNLFLILFSLFFYTWGNGNHVGLLGISILFNFILAKLIERFSNKKALLTFGVLFNLSFLIHFKYASFLIIQIDRLLLTHFSDSVLSQLPTTLPVGISFYTFMAISYLVDVYRRSYAAVGLVNFGLFLSLFPHLVAGPIVRYPEVAKEVKSRTFTIDTFFEGFTRFSLGLGKKVILANGLGVIVDKIFLLPFNELSFFIAWIGIVLYTLQIFYDFSGYTDMALGLARLLGFNFPENFNYPYRAQTMTEFWQRWHMTLRKWFVEYVYIPLGGNRNGNFQTYVNIFIVFFLTGIWHGAAWTFVIWGMYNGLILIIERFLDLNFNIKLKGMIGNIVTLFLVMVGWVFFRSTSLINAVTYLKTMFGLETPQIEYFQPSYFLDLRTSVFLVFGIIFALIPFNQLFQRVNPKYTPVITMSKGMFAVFVFVYSMIILSKVQFTPFIYFQF